MRLRVLLLFLDTGAYRFFEPEKVLLYVCIAKFSLIMVVYLVFTVLGGFLIYTGCPGKSELLWLDQKQVILLAKHDNFNIFKKNMSEHKVLHLCLLRRNDNQSFSIYVSLFVICNFFIIKFYYFIFLFLRNHHQKICSNSAAYKGCHCSDAQGCTRPARRKRSKIDFFFVHICFCFFQNINSSTL